MKTQIVTSADDSEHLLVFWCPGCDEAHSFRVKGSGRPAWTWNGDRDKPTCSPSLLIWKSKPEKRCHLFLKDGQLQFLGDCHHSLKGQSVPLPDLPEHWL